MILSGSEGGDYLGVGSGSSSGSSEGSSGDYLNSSSSSSCRVSREISCSESVLWTTNCPLVLACSGFEDGGHFQWSLYTFRIQSVFLIFIKYTHDYPQSFLDIFFKATI